MKTRNNQTLQQRFGFADDDLKTTEHDSIMLWLDENLYDLSKKLTGWTEEWPERAVNNVAEPLAKFIKERREQLSVIITEKEKQSAQTPSSKWIQTDLNKARLEFAYLSNFTSLGTPPPSFIKIDKKWEIPITQSRGDTSYIIGFIDMRVKVCIPKLDFEPRRYDPMGNMTLDPNFKELPSWHLSEGNNFARSLCFEVKASIPSLGELIRQLRMYQTYCSHTFYVVCPDDRFAPQLASQGFGFIKYPEAQIIEPATTKRS